MIIYEQAKPLLIRTPTINDVTDKILRFDSDNLYPQRAEMLIKRSLTLRAVIDRIADFINGEGFTDPVIASMIVNKQGLKGQSLNKVLTVVSKPYTAFETPVLHIGYSLNYGISSITPVPFSFIRYGLRDQQTGKIEMLAYSTNWERDGRRDPSKLKVRFYPVFNPDPEVVAAQCEAAGGIANYRGQILYMPPEEGQYPLATFDSVFDDAQSQIELGTFKVSNIQNSFLSTLAIIYPGEFGSKQEEFDFNDLISNKTGARNAGTRIGLQDRSGLKKASDIFANLTPVNIDKLFELTESTIKENIIENYSFPKILLGITPDGLFAQANMEESYTYANAITRNRRASLSEVFALLLEYWDGPEGPIQTTADIIEQRYITNTDVSAGVDINDNLKNMTGMQAINFARILRKYEQGKYTRQVAETMLMSGFGLSTEEITKLLDGIDAAKEEDTGMDAAGAPLPNAKLTQAAFMALAKEYL